MDTNTPQASAFCNRCRRNFPSSNLLKIHHDKHHYIRTCPNCYKTFRHTKKYLKHLRSHLNCCPYRCKICLKSFNEERQIGQKDEQIICRECAKSDLDYPSLNRYIMTDEKQPYTCSMCVSRFSSLTDRNVHLENHILRCELCKIPMKNREALSYHAKDVHQIDEEEYAPVPGDPCFKYPDVVISGVCDSNDDSMAESFSSDDDSDSSSIREVNADIDSVYNAKHENKFICFICLQLCPSSELLEYHMGAHDWYPCKFCKKFFICIRDLEMHKVENHNFKCTLCESTFPLESDLNLHMPKCRLYLNIKSKLNEVVQAVLEHKESDILEELSKKLKKLEKDLGGFKICVAFQKSSNCKENFCEDTVSESYVHYHFPDDFVFDVNLSNSGRNHEDLFNLSDALLQSREDILENLRSYEGMCLRFLSEISIIKIVNFVEALKYLKFPLEPQMLEQLILFKGIIEDVSKLPVNNEMPEELKNYLQHVHCYMSRISGAHITDAFDEL